MGAVTDPSREPSLDQITTIGIDLAKIVVQIHGVGENGEVVLRRKPRRGQVLSFFAGLPRCLIGMEACAGAHCWARDLIALGHEVRIVPAAYVKPYVNEEGPMPPMPRPSAKR